jgi:pyruvyltransferase
MRDGRENFGDALGPAILRRLGWTVRDVPVGDAEIVACGSILHMLTDPRTAIWGSGAMSPQRQPGVTPARVLAVRGHLTASMLGVDVPTGDPGLLVSALWDRSPARYRMGVVPHYVDANPYRECDLRIDVTAPVDDVIAQITSCSVIASSSLHGLIVAQSFGIPVMRIPHERVGGGNYKWVDHLTSLDTDIEAIQQRLVDALGEL